jgi:hypothetical protein
VSATDDAQALIDAAEALHTSLSKAWLAAMNAGDFDRAKGLKVQADRAGDQLIDANQVMLDAIDSGKDVTALLEAMAGLSDRIAAQRKKVADGTASMTGISGVLDAIGQAIATARTIAGV